MLTVEVKDSEKSGENRGGGIKQQKGVLPDALC